MKRSIKHCPAVMEELPPPSNGTEQVKVWFQNIGSRHNLCWLLAHADDGVIWGRMDNGSLVIANDVAMGKAKMDCCPPLRNETLQQAWLFSPKAEVFLWHDDGTWKARLIRDAQGNEQAVWEEAYDEPQLLWGDRREPLANDFTLLTEGSQGFRHAVPLKLPQDDAERCPQLLARHYLNREGLARVEASRLLDLKLGE